MPRPNPTDYSLFSAHYVMSVKEDDIKTALKNQQKTLETFLESIPQSKADFAYAKDKWTVKQVLQHIIDSEKIFAFRALWFARNSTKELYSFDENEFAKAVDVTDCTISSLADELVTVRKSTAIFFNQLSDEDLSKRGKLNDHYVTVNALGFILAGHLEHHIRIMKERYL